MQRRAEFFAHKRHIQEQMDLQARLRAEAQEEYVKEKGQVDAVVQKMINED